MQALTALLILLMTPVMAMNLLGGIVSGPTLSVATPGVLSPAGSDTVYVNDELAPKLEEA